MIVLLFALNRFYSVHGSTDSSSAVHSERELAPTSSSSSESNGNNAAFGTSVNRPEEGSSAISVSTASDSQDPG